MFNIFCYTKTKYTQRSYIIISKQTKALIKVTQFISLQICFSLVNNESKYRYASEAGLIFVYRGNVGGNNF